MKLEWLLPDKFWPTRTTGSGNKCDKRPISRNIEGVTNLAEGIQGSTPDSSIDDDVEDQQQEGASPTVLPHEETNSWKSRLRPRQKDGDI